MTGIICIWWTNISVATVAAICIVQSAWCSVLPPANCRQSCLSDCWC